MDGLFLEPLKSQHKRPWLARDKHHDGGEAHNHRRQPAENDQRPARGVQAHDGSPRSQQYDNNQERNRDDTVDYRHYPDCFDRTPET